MGPSQAADAWRICRSARGNRGMYICDTSPGCTERSLTTPCGKPAERGQAAVMSGPSAGDLRSFSQAPCTLQHASKKRVHGVRTGCSLTIRRRDEIPAMGTGPREMPGLKDSPLPSPSSAGLFARPPRAGEDLRSLTPWSGSLASSMPSFLRPPSSPLRRRPPLHCGWRRPRRTRPRRSRARA